MASHLYVKEELHHVTLFNDVLLAFSTQPSFVAGFCQGTGFKQLLVANGLRANEAAFEVRVNHTGGLGRGLAGLDRPSPGFLLTGCEIGEQA